MKPKVMAAVLTSVSAAEGACGAAGLGCEGDCSDVALSQRSKWSSGGGAVREALSTD